MSMGVGDVARMPSWTVHGSDGIASITASFKAPKGRVAVFLLLGEEARDGSELLDAENALNELGWFRKSAS